MKPGRHAAILDIVSTTDVETQEELAKLLEDRGFAVTQATVSRDIKALGLVKVPAPNGRYRYAVPVERSPVEALKRARKAFADFVTVIEASGNLVVVKTESGAAQGVAATIDQLQWPEVLATVAGDDSILVVARDPGHADGENGATSAAAQLMERFRALRR